MLFLIALNLSTELLGRNGAGGKAIFAIFIISLACLRVPTRVS